MKKLKAKLFINGKIQLKTGMHIGGSSTALDIGGIDSNVIKTANGIPYIPGSSIKGKLRTLYALSKGLKGINRPRDDTNKSNKYDEEDFNIIRVFGIGAKEDKKNKDELKDIERTRLIVRDAFLDKKDFDERREDEFSELELDFTEGKWENTIKRTDSSANPRQIERVPPGAVFDFSFVYNIFDEQDVENLKIVIKAMRLLQDDYLGGSGSRGYGQIEFQNIKSYIKTIENYENDNEPVELKTEIKIEKGNNDDLIKEINNKIE